MSRLQANLLLFTAAIIWGFGNIAHKTVLDHLDALSVVGLTCIIGAVITLPMAMAEMRRNPARLAGETRSLVRLAVLFTVADVLQQVAYVDTTVTNATFLVSTYTVITPLAVWLLLDQRPTLCIGLAAGLTLAGSYLLTGVSSGAMARGDMVAIATAVVVALWTIETGRHMQRFGRPFRAATFQFAVAGIVVMPFGWQYGNLSLQGVVDAWPDLAVLGVLSTALCYCLQTIAQKHTPPSQAAIIASAESVFSGFAAAVLLHERISAEGAAGAAIVLLAVLIVALANREPLTPTARPAPEEDDARAGHRIPGEGIGRPRPVPDGAGNL